MAEPGWMRAAGEEPSLLDEAMRLQHAVGNVAVRRLIAVQRHGEASGPERAAGGATSPESVLRSTGEALPPDVASSMGSALGQSMAGVRIHRDAAAARSAEALDAQAYTVGDHVVFGAGQYEPRTDAGRRLLAHELTHVVQQGGPEPLPSLDNLSVSEPTDPAEQAAEKVADDVAAAGQAGPSVRDGRPAPTEGPTAARTVLRRKRGRGATTKKEREQPSPSGVTWEDALATMNAIEDILPVVREHGIVLPGFAYTTGEHVLSRSILDKVPERYRDLVQEWDYIVHPVHRTPKGVEISIHGSMREVHLNRAIQETQPLVDELVAEGEKASTYPFLEAYWNSVARLREDITQEVIAEAVRKAKLERGVGFEQVSESEKAKTLVDKALEAVHLATKVINQFSEEAIEETVHEAKHAAKVAKLDELFREAARQAGELPHGGALQAATKMSVAAALVHVEGGLHGLSAILAVSDPAKREELLRHRSDLFGQMSVAMQGSKLALQFAAGATAVAGAGTFAVAKLLGKERLAAEVLAKGIPLLETLDTVISGVMVIHGVLTLLDSEATSEEKEEAVLEIGVGGATVLGRLIGAFEAGPATVSVVISFFTLKALAEAAVGFSVDLVRISLNMCYRYMQREASEINDQALGLAIAMQMAEYEPDLVRRNVLRDAVGVYSANLGWTLRGAIRSATVEAGARDKDPAAHEPLRKRFLPLAKRSMNTNLELLETARDYVQTVAEALAHPQEILDEEVEYVWEHYG